MRSGRRQIVADPFTGGAIVLPTRAPGPRHVRVLERDVGLYVFYLAHPGKHWAEWRFLTRCPEMAMHRDYGDVKHREPWQGTIA